MQGRQVQHEIESDVHIEDVDITPEDQNFAQRKNTSTDSDENDKNDVKQRGKAFNIAFAVQPRCLSLQKMLNTEAIDAQLRQEANLTPFNLYQTFMRNEPRKFRITSIENLLGSEGSQ